MRYRFNFCPACGKPIKTNKKIINCRNCFFTFYINPSPTSALILENEKGEILLTKRKYPPKKGFWDLPGGFVEQNETIEEFLIREIKEELGITIDKIEYFGSHTGLYLYNKFQYQTLSSVFTTKYKGEKITVNDDVVEYKFFAKDKIPFKRLSFIDIKNALKKFIRLST